MKFGVTKIIEIQIHRIVTISLGSPPTKFIFEYTDNSRQYHKIGPISPVDFYLQFVQPVFNINEKVNRKR